MRLPVVFRPAARDENLRAIGWYERQQTGLGFDFAELVENVIDTIAVQPAKYPIVLRDTREAPVKKFPYFIYYRVRSNRVVVVAVFHASRDPSEWQPRV